MTGITASAYRGGERVRPVQTQRRTDLEGKTLIVVAPQGYFRVSTTMVQCFDPETGYIWPMAPDELERVGR